ncbi:MAG: sigma-70 family RNA polymerase sigma factor [Candidatus Latescibacteria bacterium]|nr:sigma-70 family RNA polymerase sigma factor [Candidatus Latescibacterota bacterium]
MGQFRGPVASFARTLGVRSEECEDVAQSTLAAFAKGYRDGKYDPAKGRLRSWLFGIAYRQALSQRRRDGAAGVAVASDADAALLDEKAASNAWDRLWDRHLLETAIRRASEEFSAPTFRVFDLVVLEDRSTEDAARELGIDVRAVYNAKHRVVKRVRELIAELEGADA